MKILLIEDDKEILNLVETYLSQHSFTVESTEDGCKGSFLARTNKYDLIIMDYSLPQKDGITVCEEIREAEIETPIIFLTKYAEVRRKVIAFDKGADDYITKPFSFEELRARIEAISRRPKPLLNSVIKVEDLILDTKKKTVTKSGLPIYLTRKTYDLLEYLMKNKGVVISRGVIMESVWEENIDPFSNTVEAHISNLRKKINAKGKKNLLRNIPGRGYVIGA